ncbi:hypothetical protein FA95DRAFT_484388 [Auriscalpium vulgare]|uniref:Uncharacterized protein n=1 Tax=Auriscalpium vulgare TaxID=40419 RepID=A0ACB8SCP4_9AGAM|nr:hypothetical protein FA95DRAFT_484388 [Auriscalpium vulgare]
MAGGASAADVRSILSLPASSTPGPSQSKKSATSTKKPEGISRELYSLIGASAPTLAAQVAKPRLKQKPNLGGGGKVKWQWRNFKNGARTDGLELGHWVKAHTDPDAEYPFAKYNVKGTEYTYSQDDYTRLLEDPAWSKEETDYLFSLVQEFDSRFYIVADRYEYPGGTERSMEDLKDRYYSVCRKLIRNRPWAGDEASKSQLISSFQFDKDREVTRKKYLSSLEDRTPEQLAEEEALYVELKRLEQTERRFKKERDELLRTLAGVDSGLPDLPFDEDGPLGDPKKRKNGRLAELESPATPSSATFAAPPPRRAQSARSIAYDALHLISRTDPPPASASTTKASHQAATLRSFKIAYPKSAVAAKVTQVVAELGVSLNRLVVPSRDTLAQHEALLEAASALVETKKVVDRVDQDIRVARARLGLRESEGAETPMEVDGEGGGSAPAVLPEESRAQSVVSTRSARSRKPTGASRRSGSVSSVDASVTSTTRAGTKRQKLS